MHNDIIIIIYHHRYWWQQKLYEGYVKVSNWAAGFISSPDQHLKHQQLRLEREEFTMWTLLVLCSVILSQGVQGIVHYFLYSVCLFGFAFEFLG